MGVTLLPLVVPVLLAGAVVLAALSVYAWRHRTTPSGNRWFTLLMALNATLVFAYALALLVGSSWRLLAEAVTLAVAGFIPVVWVGFLLHYLGYGEKLTRRHILLACGVPAASVVLFPTNALGVHEFAWSSVRVTSPAGGGISTVVLGNPGPWFLTQVAYTYVLFLTVLALVVRLVASYDRLYVDQSVALLVGTVAPLAANAAATLGLTTVPGLRLFPLALPITGLTYGYAVYRSELLAVSPESKRVGEQAVIDDLEDGIVILDEVDRIVSVNEAALSAFESDESAVMGESVETLFETVDICLDDLPAEFVTVDDDYYQVSVSPIEDELDRQVGKTVTIRDVTAQETRRQRLEVLNRLLRHNLRNTLAVVQGHAELVKPHLEDGATRHAEKIITATDDLVALSKKASETDAVTAEMSVQTEAVALETVVERVVRTSRKSYPEAEFTVELPGTPVVDANEKVLGTVMRNVVENAVEHCDADVPEVRVTWRPTVDGLVEIAIHDNGPGIPESERQVIEAGRETDLDHGSGIGLWVIYWGMTSMNGAVDFGESHPRGTVVRLRLPAGEESELPGRAPDDVSETA